MIMMTMIAAATVQAGFYTEMYTNDLITNKVAPTDLETFWFDFMGVNPAAPADYTLDTDVLSIVGPILDADSYTKISIAGTADFTVDLYEYDGGSYVHIDTQAFTGGIGGTFNYDFGPADDFFTYGQAKVIVTNDESVPGTDLLIEYVKMEVTTGAPPVPEPSSMALLMIGCSALAAYRKKRMMS